MSACKDARDRHEPDGFIAVKLLFWVLHMAIPLINRTSEVCLNPDREPKIATAISAGHDAVVIRYR